MHATRDDVGDRVVSNLGALRGRFLGTVYGACIGVLVWGFVLVLAGYRFDVSRWAVGLSVAIAAVAVGACFVVRASRRATTGMKRLQDQYARRMDLQLIIGGVCSVLGLILAFVAFSLTPLVLGWATTLVAFGFAAPTRRDVAGLEPMTRAALLAPRITVTQRWRSAGHNEVYRVRRSWSYPWGRLPLEVLWLAGGGFLVLGDVGLLGRLFGILFLARGALDAWWSWYRGAFELVVAGEDLYWRTPLRRGCIPRQGLVVVGRKRWPFAVVVLKTPAAARSVAVLQRPELKSFLAYWRIEPEASAR
jgi:hypothetical protein